MEIKRVFVALLQVFISGLLLCFNHQVASQQIGGQQFCLPTNWHQITIGNKVTCLWLSKEKASWIDAMSWCKLMDGQLVELQSASFNRELANMITYQKTGKYWIGLSNMEDDRILKWMTSKKTATWGTSFFKPGLQLSGQAKHCVVTDDKGEWIVEPCKTENWFICQKNSQYKGSSKKIIRKKL